MKKIDFSNLKMEVRIGEYNHLDIRKELGNALFSNATSLEVDQLARKVFNAPIGSIELDNQEYDLLLQTLGSTGLKFAAITAIKDNVKDE